METENIGSNECEVKAVYAGIEFIVNHYKEMYPHEPALTEQTIDQLHWILMSPVNRRIAGTLSHNERKTGNNLFYPNPYVVKEHLTSLVDDAYAMTLYFHCIIKNNGITRCIVKRVIKFIAFLFHCFVSLHLYADGNGRTARLIACFLHNLLSLLPLSVCNLSARNITYSL